MSAHTEIAGEDCPGCARAVQTMPLPEPPASPTVEHLVVEILRAFPALEYTRTDRTGERATAFLRELLTRALRGERERLANLIDALADRGDTSAVRSAYSAIRLASATIRVER